MISGYKKLEHYGIVGNLQTCALIGNDGSVDWMCLPYLVSESVFASILDNERGGNFSISPQGKFESIQKYIPDTNILQTTFNCSTGIVNLTDFMVARRENFNFTALLRKVELLGGTVPMHLRFYPRFNYAREPAYIEPSKDGIKARWSDRAIYLDVPFRLEFSEQEARGTFILTNDKPVWVIMRYGDKPVNHDPEMLLRSEIDFWVSWVNRCDRKGTHCVFEGPWHEMVDRSELVIKLLANQETGAIAAALTTSLPERIGGVRNWDYRYAWLRDTAFSAQALLELGHETEFNRFRKWVRGIIAGAKDPSDINVLYPVHGIMESDESILEHLTGYRGSAPVRIGNKARHQFQLDIFGELLNTLYHGALENDPVPEEIWPAMVRIVNYVIENWMKPDRGIWEVRSQPRHFVYSKLMCWVAVDRGLKIAEMHGFGAPVKEWEDSRDTIRKAILERGFNRKTNSFAAAFDSDDLDAALLLIPFMGLLPADDERVKGTVDAVIRELARPDGLVRRYKMEDGLPGDEGGFVMCSFWLVQALSIVGREEEAARLFEKILMKASPLGLFSEEIDFENGELLGNFPQAFSHMGLINAAIHIGLQNGKTSRAKNIIGLSARSR